MHRKILLWGIGFAITAVLLGAFGAHALKSFLTPEKLQSYETGVRYQLIHALALIALSIYGQINKTNDFLNKGIGWSAHFFIVGTFLFSGSIYGLALLSVIHPSWAFILGPVTPIGGLFFMLGWAIWARFVWLNKVDL
ncbi:MAG: hypothetical protein RLZZ266_1204 [Bacteroidota bacterium]|jgi:uncharacterized membrane protein YgdD (TMEM256/DUF423 family)